MHGGQIRATSTAALHCWASSLRPINPSTATKWRLTHSLTSPATFTSDSLSTQASHRKCTRLQQGSRRQHKTVDTPPRASAETGHRRHVQSSTCAHYNVDRHMPKPSQQCHHLAQTPRQVASRIKNLPRVGKPPRPTRFTCDWITGTLGSAFMIMPVHGIVTITARMSRRSNGRGRSSTKQTRTTTTATKVRSTKRTRRSRAKLSGRPTMTAPYQ